MGASATGPYGFRKEKGICSILASSSSSSSMERRTSVTSVAVGVALVFFFIESLHVFQDGFEMAFELVSKRFAQHFFAVFHQDGKVRGDCVAVLGECDIWPCQPFTSERLQSFEYFRRLRCLIGTSIRCYEASGTLLPPLDSIISNDERLRTSFFLL